MSRPSLPASMAIALLCGATVASCHEPTAPPVVATRPEAALSIEPPRLRIGDAVEVRIALRTPPDHHLAPWQPPEIEGAWLLDVDVGDVRREPGQWLHDLRVRLRPRELGELRWPDTRLVVVDAEDREIAVPIDGRAFEVVAPPPVFAERDGPFGMLEAAPEPGGVGWSAVAAAAAAGALAALAGPWAWRRWAASHGEPPRPDAVRADDGPDLYTWAEHELDAAREALDREPLVAARRAARTLRAFVDRRFQAAVRARTTPELAAGDPPFSARSRWPWFLRVLGDLDDLRFREPTGARAASDCVRRAAAALEETRRFVEQTRPGGRRS
ncbi:MAG: hypothetical protein ACQGVK_20025 [Myxococcota bacterium]